MRLAITIITFACHCKQLEESRDNLNRHRGIFSTGPTSLIISSTAPSVPLRAGFTYAFDPLTQGISRLVVHSSRPVLFLSSCMALRRAVLATIGRGRVGFLCFLHSIRTVVEIPQVLPVCFDWQPLTTIFVNLMVSVVLCVCVYTIFSHNKPRFLFHFLRYTNEKTGQSIKPTLHRIVKMLTRKRMRFTK